MYVNPNFQMYPSSSVSPLVTISFISKIWVSSCFVNELFSVMFYEILHISDLIWYLPLSDLLHFVLSPLGLFLLSLHFLICGLCLFPVICVTNYLTCKTQKGTNLLFRGAGGQSLTWVSRATAPWGSCGRWVSLLFPPSRAAWILSWRLLLPSS